jgi:hypothetical protein
MGYSSYYMMRIEVSRDFDVKGVLKVVA